VKRGSIRKGMDRARGRALAFRHVERETSRFPAAQGGRSAGAQAAFGSGALARVDVLAKGE